MIIDKDLSFSELNSTLACMPVVCALSQLKYRFILVNLRHIILKRNSHNKDY